MQISTLKRLALAAAATTAMVVGGAHAATTTQSVNVTATVVTTCVFTGSAPAAFSTTIDPTATATLLGTGSVTLACNKGAAPQITVGNGNNFATGTRNMKNASNDLLAYTVMMPSSGFTTCPAAGSGTPYGTFSMTSGFATAPVSAQTLSICGQLTTPQLSASGGAYTDAVVVTATY